MNLLLVAIDTLRADHLGCYGYSRNTSPFLDDFARGGVLFNHYFATTIPTHPSFTTLFTGMDAYGHRVVNVKGAHEPSENIPFLAEVLRDAGFRTAAVDTMGLWMSRGFDSYEDPGYHVDNEEPYDCGYGRTRRDKRFGGAVTGKAIEVMDGLTADEPFFLFVHYWDPHQPYYPPKPYCELYYDGDPTDPRHTSMRPYWAFRAKGPWNRRWIDEAVTDAEYWVAMHDAEINYTDDQVKTLLGAAQERGLWDDTLAIILADHGEVMYEHPGEFDHETLYDCNVRVPLLIRFPGEAHAGERVPGLTTNLDVMPTALELLGVDCPTTVGGVSLMPLVDGRQSELRREVFLGESTWQCKRGIRTSQWKLIRALSDTPEHNWRGTPPKELYYLPDDPDEQANLIHTHPRVAAELERRLDAYLADCESRHGHPDPLAVQGTTFGRKALANAEERDDQVEDVLRQPANYLPTPGTEGTNS